MLILWNHDNEQHIMHFQETTERHKVTENSYKTVNLTWHLDTKPQNCRPYKTAHSLQNTVFCTFTSWMLLDLSQWKNKHSLLPHQLP